MTSNWRWTIALGLGLISVETAEAVKPMLAEKSPSHSPVRVAAKRTPASRLVQPKQVAQAEELPPLQPPPPNAGLEQPVPQHTPDLPPVAPSQPEQVPAVADRGIFRLEPPDKLVEVDAADLKPGIVYLHYSQKFDRQVWSFLQASGEFWHAFGPGTTMSIDHFDLRMTEEEALDALRKIDPRFAFQIRSSAGAKVFLRLGPDNTWKLVRTTSVTSIFDLETRQRWERQWDRFMPVVHLCGDDWEFRDGTYQAPQWGPWMQPN